MSDLKEFLNLYVDRLQRATTAGETPIIRFSDPASREIVLSFDKKYRPFIPSNLGYNKSENRIIIRECKFTRELGLELHKARIDMQDINGGRVFVRNDGSYLKLKDGRQIKFSSMSLSE